MTRKTLNLCIFCGARPNFMKVAPIIRVINKQANENIAYSLIYAGTKKTILH